MRPAPAPPPSTRSGISTRRFLCRVEDHRVFAYTRGHDVYRCADHSSYAHMRDGRLISARSGEPIAYQIGSMFYDPDTHRPLYYINEH